MIGTLWSNMRNMIQEFCTHQVQQPATDNNQEPIQDSTSLDCLDNVHNAFLMHMSSLAYSAVWTSTCNEKPIKCMSLFSTHMACQFQRPLKKKLYSLGKTNIWQVGLYRKQYLEQLINKSNSGYFWWQLIFEKKETTRRIKKCLARDWRKEDNKGYLSWRKQIREKKKAEVTRKHKIP